MEAGSGRPLLSGGRRFRARSRGTAYLLPLAAGSLLAGSVAAAARAVEPFDHGVWLVAYLLLVGSLAPLLFGIGEAAALAHAPDARRSAGRAVLWAAGTIAVPLGVFGDSRLLVLAGSVALILSLWSMALTLYGNADTAHRIAVAAYAGLLVFMAGSVCVGLALAWDLPW